MTREQVEELFLTDGWTWQFDSSVVLQGKRLMRDRSVMGVTLDRLEDGTLMIGSEAEGFRVEVVLWENAGGIQVEASCSCEFSNQCAHAAATLHMLGKPAGQEQLARLFLDETAQSASDIRQWTEALKKVSRPQIESERSSEVLYLLMEKAGTIHLQVRTIRLAAQGERRGKLAVPKISQTEFSLAFREVDRMLCRELLGYQKVGTADWELGGEGMAQIFSKVLQTGRCHWISQDGVRLRLGEPRQGRCDWAVTPEGKRPILSISPEAAFTLNTEPFFYIDPERAEAGTVESDQNPALLKTWVAGPLIPADQCEEVSLQLIETEGLEALSCPTVAKEEVLADGVTFEMTVAERVICGKGLRHHLQLEDDSLLCAAVYVIYGSYRFPLGGVRQAGVERVQTSRGTVMVTRDLDAEARALLLLENLGLVSPLIEAVGMGGDLGPLSSDERALWVSGLRDFTPGQYWTSFMARRAEKMREEGWTVIFEGDEPQPISVSAADVTLQMDEAGAAWFALSAGFEVDGKRYELQPILADLLEMGGLEKDCPLFDEESFFYYPKNSNEVLSLPSGRMKMMLHLLRSLLLEFKGGAVAKVPLVEAALLAAENEDIEAPEALKQLGERLKKPSLEGVEPSPAGLQATLRSYQEEGFRWMQMLAKYGFNGILADDMGLGKTLQTLAHVLAEKESGRSGGTPSLVLAPTSVVNNWKAEAKKWAPSLSVLVLQGSERKKHFKEMGKHDLVVTSYALLARDIARLREQSFHIAALDEAQHIKTPGTQVAQAARELEAKHRLCLSGTPIENHLGELWSLMAFLMPGMLGSHEDFTTKVRTPIEKYRDEEARLRLVRQVGPLILRRTKDEVAKDLPPKTEIVHSIELSPEQKDLYETVRVLMDKRVRNAIATAGMESSNIVFLDALMKLRQICCHPRLLGKTTMNRTMESAKLDYLAEQLDTLIAEGRKVLIFSQFTSMLDLIEAHVVSRGFTYLKLTGASQHRQDMVDRFQAGDIDIFMISLKAGGTGLTLTAADSVIHYDPWWNPAAENQATDRAYRIGQDKPVFVHKLICRDTVEQRIQELQSDKSQLADALLDGSTKSFSLNEESLTSLLAPLTQE